MTASCSRLATTALLALALGCGGPSAPARAPVSTVNDWADRLALQGEVRFAFGGKVYTRRRFVVAAGAPLACRDEATRKKFWPYVDLCGKPCAIVDERLIVHTERPTFFFDELSEGGHVVAELAPRRIQLVPGRGIFLEAPQTQLRAHAITAYPYPTRISHGKVSDDGADRWWAFEGEFGKGRATHRFAKYERFDPEAQRAVPSDVLVVESLGDGGETAVVTEGAGTYGLEIVSAGGVRIGAYAGYLPRAWSRTGIVTIGPRDRLITLKEKRDGEEQEYDLLLDEHFLPKGSPPGRVLLTGQAAYVALRGSNLFWPLGDRQVPPGIVGVIPRDSEGSPIPFAYDPRPRRSHFVKYADGEALRWGLADASLTKLSGPTWKTLAWSAAFDTKNASNYTWKNPLLVAQGPDGTWTAFQQSNPLDRANRDRDEPFPVGKGATFQAAVAAAGAKYAEEVAAVKKRMAENDAYYAGVMAAEAQRQQAERDRQWDQAVRTRNRTAIGWLVNGASDPEKWITYADTLREDASLSALADAERFERDPARKARIQAAMQRVRDAQADAAKRAAEMAAARLKAQAPAPPPPSSGTWTAPPVTIDRSGYENLVKENFARSQSGQNPWGRSCWGSGC